MKRIATLLFTLTLLPACTSSSAKDYFINRGGDLVDILRGHVMVGKGASAKLEVTRMLHLGLGYESDVWAWGLANREVTSWRETIFTWGLILGRHDEINVTGTTEGRISGTYGWTFGENGGNGFTLADPNNWLDFLTVRGTLMLGVGIDLEIRAGEVLDFVAGIFQFDPAGDDVAVSKLKVPATES